MTGYVIFDGKGYFVRRRRDAYGKAVQLWSSLKEDAAVFHFRAVAEKIASTIPFKVRIQNSPAAADGIAK